jgi:hypothetical protein
MNPIETKNPLVNGRVIKTDCPIKEYLASKCGENGEPRILSRGDLCQIHTCAARWHKGFEEPERRLPSIEFGSLFDCLLLQPDRFEEYYTLAPDEYTNSKKQVVPWTWKSSTCREWREEQEASGKLVCSSDDMIDAGNAVKALREHPEIGPQTIRLLDSADIQVFVMAEYHDPDTGIVVPVKCLTDIVPSRADPDFAKSLFDLKTARSAHPRAWAKAVFDGNYHVQAALNLDCHNAISGSDRCDFRHLVVENVAPYEVARYFLTQEYIEAGRVKYLEALRLYCACLKSGYWPSYMPCGNLVLPDGYQAIQPEVWMLGKDSPISIPQIETKDGKYAEESFVGALD